MEQPLTEITGNTSIDDAIAILKQKADCIARSEEAAKFYEENPHWSHLYRKSYKPHDDAVAAYEEALRVNEWLNGKDPENGQITVEEMFRKMSDQQRLSLFHKRINSTIPGIFDEYLRAWWMSRY